MDIETLTNRTIDVSDYMPPVVRDTDEFKQIAAAENPEFNELQQRIAQILQDAFVETATEYGVRRWESMLNLIPENGDTLDARKVRILTYLNIHRPYTWRVLKQMLVPFLGGEDKFVMEYVNDEGKLVLHTDRLDDAMLAAVNNLLERVLPQNIEVVRYNHTLKVPWREWVPGYHPVEYLENESGNEVYVMTDVLLSETLETRIKLNAKPTFVSRALGIVLFKTKDGDSAGYQLIYYQGKFSAKMGTQAFTGGLANVDNEFILNATDGTVSLNGEVVMDGLSYTIKDGYTNEQLRIPIFDGKYFDGSTPTGQQSFKGRIYKVEFYDKGELLARFMPAINDEGAPCMLDIVSKTAYYNEGAGDFSYPTDAAPAVSAGLDDTFYAKITEHGVRRLYHVPKGCNMTKDEYAAANGFKELVEPPMPMTGYWTPEWRETETQLILEWIETEEPKEEVTENE